jgi:tol-pal system protein YbgF
MKKMTRMSALGAIIVLSVLCLGAGKSLYGNSSRDQLLNRLESLEKQNAQLRQQVQDLSTKVEVLSQRVNASCGGQATSGAFNPASAALSSAPPLMPGLETVRLKPQDQAPAPPKGRLIITNSEGDNTVLIEHGTPLPGTNYVPLPDPATTMNQAGDSETAVAPVPAAAPAVPPSKDEAAAFSAIKELIDQGKNGDAQPLMSDYLARFPKGAHEDKVAFWLGNYYFSANEYEKAIHAFKVVADSHYETQDAPESLFKIGMSCLQLGKTDDAKSAFQNVKILYPFSEMAEKAEKMLSSCCP